MPGNIEKSSKTLKNNPDQIGMERLIFFSDAVFAIAITLLTLEIRLPATDGSLTNAELLQSILAIGPKYIAYIISFLVIGLFWIGHHRKFQLIRKYDGTLMFFKLAFTDDHRLYSFSNFSHQHVWKPDRHHFLCVCNDPCQSVVGDNLVVCLLYGPVD